MDRDDKELKNRPHKHVLMRLGDDIDERRASNRCEICGKPILQYGSKSISMYVVMILADFLSICLWRHPTQNGTDVFIFLLIWGCAFALICLYFGLSKYCSIEEIPKNWRCRNLLAAIAYFANCLWLVMAIICCIVEKINLYEHISFAAILDVAVQPIIFVAVIAFLGYAIVKFTFLQKARPTLTISDIIQLNAVAVIMFVLGDLPIPLVCLSAVALLAQIPAYVIMKKREEAK